ncbi:MAG TPA: hypothetical protein PKY77_18000 [Phycisphaerae bacterium]|nr:hypothetical protein [Phycisphaerae bacterium]HRY70254.1 hypothetical protein [Phycisphaerae bacterium]HSA27575.1 hypothetical protein [Phycisphaerae bacterium]
MGMTTMDQVLNANPWLDRLFGEISGTGDTTLGIQSVLIRLVSAAFLGWIIGQVYRRTFTGVRLNAALPDTHTLLALGGAIIWLVVGDNLARAFGLGGMVGLIRYRTIVPDPKDTTLLLFSLLMGMACGLGQPLVAWCGTIVLIMVMAFLHYGQRGKRVAEEENLTVLQAFESAPQPSKEPEKKELPPGK